jgi:Icc-related predicted phosphoesterase
MPLCFFVSDLHGQITRYEKLFAAVRESRPNALFIGGDVLPSRLQAGSSMQPGASSFITDYLLPEFKKLKHKLAADYPRVFIILGNDDPRTAETGLWRGQSDQLWEYIHNRTALLEGVSVFGYACIPPSPFLLKDWERYDVSQFVDVGCIPPEGGYRTIPIPVAEIKRRTIWEDLQALGSSQDVSRAICLFHAPPYQTILDRAALDGQMIDHAPLDVHLGSIAIKRFIETYQPRLTLHGHIHEAPRLTQAWQTHIGRTLLLTAAHDGPELALVQFDLSAPEDASRKLLYRLVFRTLASGYRSP